MAVEPQMLKQKSGQLKRVTTKELTGPSAEDIQSIAKIYEEFEGSIEVLCTHFGISKELLRDSPPEDAETFAKSLLEGMYLVDKDAKVQLAFRDRLQIELKRTTSKLRASITKEFTGLNEADVQAAAKIYQDHCGDLDTLAKACGISWEVLVERPPADARDFGENLLLGHYSIDKSEAAKAQLRDNLYAKVRKMSGELKKTKTKESSKGVSEQQVAVLAKMWDEKTSVEEVAKRCGMSVTLLKAKPPADSEDFARKAFAGLYTEVETEAAKADFREKLADQVTAMTGKLKSTVTQRPRSNTEEDLAGFAKFFTDHDGDLAKIAMVTGIPLNLLKSFPPTDDGDFAQKLLYGTYSPDKDEEAKMKFRYRMRSELLVTKNGLKRTSTKVWDGKSTEEDIQLFAKIYTDAGGNLEEIAQLHSLDLAMMEEHRPDSAEDFARKLLMGDFTPEYVAVAKRAVREEMVRNLKPNHMPKLRRAETKESLNDPQPGDIALVAKVFNEHKGDLKALASFFSTDQQSVLEAQPKDANDFALKLLSGAFAHAEQEDMRDKLRGILGKGIRRPSLKAAETKEALGEPKEEDIANFCKVFDAHGGDLAKVATELKCDVSMLKKDAPTDGRKFAAKYLAGHYRA